MSSCSTHPVGGTGKQGYVLDEQRIARTEGLLGIKGYCTNIPRSKLDNKAVIARYQDLWHVEKAFRMAKSDQGKHPCTNSADPA